MTVTQDDYKRFLRTWWYIGGPVGALGEPHSLWALRLRIELGRNLPDVRR